MMATNLPSASIVGAVALARSSAGNDQYLTQSRCVDWLLDCLNAAVRPAVRRLIMQQLSAMLHLNLVLGSEFQACLDQILLAAQVDAAYDQLELDEGNPAKPDDDDGCIDLDAA